MGTAIITAKRTKTTARRNKNVLMLLHPVFSGMPFFCWATPAGVACSSSPFSSLPAARKSITHPIGPITRSSQFDEENQNITPDVHHDGRRRCIRSSVFRQRVAAIDAFGTIAANANSRTDSPWRRSARTITGRAGGATIAAASTAAGGQAQHRRSGENAYPGAESHIRPAGQVEECA